MEYPLLEKELKSRALLFEEIKMWLRLGFYISGETVRVGDSEAVVLMDSEGYQVKLNAAMGKRMRMAVLRWWEVEKVKPRAQEPLDNTGLSELENRSA